MTTRPSGERVVPLAVRVRDALTKSNFRPSHAEGGPAVEADRCGEVLHARQSTTTAETGHRPLGRGCAGWVAAQRGERGSRDPPAADAGPGGETHRQGPDRLHGDLPDQGSGREAIRIKGEWSFASAADIAKDPTNPNADTGNTWEPGDFPLSTPNAGSAANWPVEDLKLDRKSGIWSYTTALRPGCSTTSSTPTVTRPLRP